MLGHKSITNTMTYIQLIRFENYDNFTCRRARGGSYNTVTQNQISCLRPVVLHGSNLNLSYNDVVMGTFLIIGWDLSGVIIGNYIYSVGIAFVFSSRCDITMTNNTVEGCDYAFDLWNCSGLYAYHNNFITESGVFLEEYNSTCIWDNGYPSGGNYWSNYTGKDVRRGVDQDMLGSDGIGDTPYVFDENHQDNYPLMKPYSWDTHDVGVTSTTSTKTVVGQNLTAQVEVMTFNYGIHPETINMTVYANSTIIAEVRNIELQSRSYNLTSSYWNATSLSKGNYTIRTYITPVPAEEETEDNNFTKCWIIVSIVGDITGPDGWPNGKCDMRDVGLVANGFGANRVTNKTDPRYGQYWHSIPCGTCPHSPNCDVVYDGKIDMKDIGTVARHFGETDP